ncbi:hypothetical protein [Streptomyces sp. NPDC058613]
MTVIQALGILERNTTTPRDDRARAEVLAAFAALRRLTAESENVSG